MRMRLAIVATLFVLTVARTALAQPATAEAPAVRTSLAMSAGALVIFPTFGGRLSVPLTPSLALEGAVEVVPWTIEEDRAKWLLFQPQVRHTVGRWRSWQMHATYGITLFGRYTHHPEKRQTRPDGSVLVFPEHRRLRIAWPAGLHGGFGGERSLSPHAAVRWDVQALVPATLRPIPIPRISFGVAWQPGAAR
jgi:hypothetical protein